MKLASFTALEKLTLDLSEHVQEGEDGILHVTVDKNAITPAMQNAVQEDEYNLGLLVASITAMVKEWDLIEEDGNPVPLTSQAVSEIGAFFLFHLFSKISEALNEAAEEEGKDSAASS